MSFNWHFAPQVCIAAILLGGCVGQPSVPVAKFENPALRTLHRIKQGEPVTAADVDVVSSPMSSVVPLTLERLSMPVTARFDIPSGGLLTVFDLSRRPDPKELETQISEL